MFVLFCKSEQVYIIRIHSLLNVNTYLYITSMNNNCNTNSMKGIFFFFYDSIERSKRVRGIVYLNEYPIHGIFKVPFRFEVNISPFLENRHTYFTNKIILYRCLINSVIRIVVISDHQTLFPYRQTEQPNPLE